MDLATTESCLHVGAWVPRTRPGRNLSRLYGDMATRFPERVRNSLKSMACPERRKELEVPIQRWRGVDCSDAQVSDAFDGQFGGVFSNASQPVAIAVLGDSVGQQLRVALQLAQLHNRHLRRLTIATDHSTQMWESLRPLNLATIPRSEGGVLELLRSIVWPANHMRIVLAGSGVWYNLWPYCSGANISLFSQSSGQCGLWTNGVEVTPDLVQPNHERPQESYPRGWTPKMRSWRSGYVPSWGWYSWGRRLQGTATAKEYGDDVSTFLRAAANWSTPAESAYERNASSVVWFETAPQHFSPSGGCSDEPGTPPGAGSSLPPAVKRACANADPDCIDDWRNAIAMPLLRDAGMPIVPLAAALASRADLHTSNGGDCTHWCEPSEATVTMAEAALNVVAAQVRRQLRGGLAPVSGRFRL